MTTATIEREQLAADVLIVGGGPAGLSCAIHLARLIKQHNQSGGSPALSAEEIYVLEKAEELGLHSLSGAVMDPRGLAELIPDFEKQGAPLDTPVGDDAAYYFTEKRAFRAPITPPPLRNHGNTIVSLAKLTRWLGERAEAAGVNIFTGFAGTGLLLEGERVAGVRTDDKGIDRDGKRKPNFQAGYELRARVTVLAEGTRGSLTKELISRFHLDAGRNPEVFSVGVKELWEVPEGRLRPGTVWHTMGYPLGSDMYGGGWIYGMRNNRVSLGLKQLQPNVWEEFFKNHMIGDVVIGRVVRLTDFGAFVEIQEGVEGLIHVSEIAEERVEKPADRLEMDQAVTTKIIKLDITEQKIGLSIKAAAHDESREDLRSYMRTQGGGGVNLGEVAGHVDGRRSREQRRRRGGPDIPDDEDQE